MSVLRSVDLALTLLLRIAAHPDERLTDLAQNMGETKPRLHRMLRTLEQRGFVTRGSNARYRLGSGALVIGTAAIMQVDLVRLAGPVVESLGVKVNETIQLRIHDNGEALCVAKYEPSRDLRVHAALGRRRPLYAGSSKVLLAHMPPAMIEALLPATLDPITPQTITDRSKLEETLRLIRECGFCVSYGEVRDHLCAVSVPIRAVGGTVVASLNVAAPVFRTEKTDIDRFTVLLLEAAKKIGEGLGYDGST